MAKFTRRDKALMKMAALPKAVRDAAANETRKQANELAALIERRAPIAMVDGGELKASVAVHQGGAPGVNKAKADPDMTFDIVAGGPAAFYARWQEFGTPHHGAQPFFFTSYRQKRTSMKRKISTAIGKAARALAKR
jgi:HK97 gp10 family phage protein